MGRPGKLIVGILTSSRADYGIYLPLLRRLQGESFFRTEIIAFGTHLSERFGQTVDQIEADGFSVAYRVDTMAKGDASIDIGRAMGKTMQAMAKIFERRRFDLLFSLGDRYEMFAAVAATAPFNIPVAHLHGGETTLGAIDNSFRHSITTFSKLHFTSTEVYKNRVTEIIGTQEGVFNVGALSIDNLKSIRLLDKQAFHKKYGLDLNRPTVLFTFHPETIGYAKNEKYIREITSSLNQLSNKYQIIVTMPNADTMGLVVREKLNEFGRNKPGVWLVESLGTLGYLSTMKHCAFMLGNTSSGFVEAAYFPKIVINLGDRQKGRIQTKNIISVEIKKRKILEAAEVAEKMKLPTGCNIYGDGNAAERIVEIIKKEFAKNG
jgi:GDP/UDP-N,N'-diacetylbacillosamine 2-epimerase (hydrolysing)